MIAFVTNCNCLHIYYSVGSGNFMREVITCMGEEFRELSRFNSIAQVMDFWGVAKQDIFFQEK